MTGSTLSPPDVRDPRPAADERALTGRRVIVASGFEDDPDLVSYLRDWRATSDPFTEAGRTFVRVVPEADWYAWVNSTDPGKPSSCPKARAWPAEFVWVE